jgi:hypothetical protein
MLRSQIESELFSDPQEADAGRVYREDGGFFRTPLRKRRSLLALRGR